MPTLILYLPSSAATAQTEYDYAVLGDDGQAASQGRARASLLPSIARGAEVIAVAPARALSWHALTLPDRVASGLLSGRTDATRSRAILGGALEEHLLDDVDRLHFAVFAGTTPKAPLWVAVCERSWLQTNLQALESAGRPVTRVVAEFEPLPQGQGALVLVTNAMEPAQVALCTPAGVVLLPAGEAATALAKAHSPLEVLAEPAVMELAEQAFGVPVQAHTLAQRLARAAQSGWNLAQLDMRSSQSGRAVKRLGDAWRNFRSAPQWRPVRWGVVALLLTQVVALNAMAYRQNALLAEKRAAIRNVMAQTFPQVPVIVDAPVQMQREVAALAQARGAGDADIARLLTAVSAAIDPARKLTAIDFSGGELRVKAGDMAAADAAAVASALGAQGWTARLDGDQLVVHMQGAR